MVYPSLQLGVGVEYRRYRQRQLNVSRHDDTMGCVAESKEEGRAIEIKQ